MFGFLSEGGFSFFRWLYSLGNCALVLACMEGNLVLVEALLASGASVKVRDKDGYSPIHVNTCLTFFALKLARIISRLIHGVIEMFFSARMLI